jgi:large subunit ribosomal protein L31
MKPDIHPKYETATITCACGNKIETRSTRQNLRIDVCSRCHPFYAGEQRLMDTGGQVERFRRRAQRAAQAQAAKS